MGQTAIHLSEPIQLFLALIVGFIYAAIGYCVGVAEERRRQKKLDDVEPVEETEHFLST